MEAERVWERIEGVLELVPPLGRGVVTLAVSVVLDALEVWLSPSERLASSRLSVTFPGTLVLFVGARVFTVGPAAPVGKPGVTVLFTVSL